MKLLLSSLGLAGALALGESLRTEYHSGDALHVTRTTKTTMKTTNVSMERDGEPMDRGNRGGNRDIETVRKVVYVDRIQEVTGDLPTKIQRTFETIEGQFTMGDQDVELSSPLNGMVLLLTGEDGEVEVELEEGSVDDEAMLEGHALSLPLDALLPADAVAPGDEWELEEGEGLIQALCVGLDPKLFLPPELELGGRGGGRGGEGRGGGGRPRGGGGGIETLLQQADWDIALSLSAETEEHAGEECLVIEIEAEGSGELEEPERGGQRRGREFSSDPVSPTFEASRRGSEFEIEMSGKLFYSKEARRPVHFEIHGEVSVETEREFTRGESTMRMQRSQEGTFEQNVVLSEG